MSVMTVTLCCIYGCVVIESCDVKKAVVNLSFVGYTRSGAQGLADCFIHRMCHLYNLPYHHCSVLHNTGVS